MTKLWMYTGALALMALCTQCGVPARQEVTLHDAQGREMKVPLRKALPVDAPRVRYPGFNPDTLILKAGSVRREGAMPLPCDILLERDVPIRPIGWLMAMPLSTPTNGAPTCRRAICSTGGTRMPLTGAM